MARPPGRSPGSSYAAPRPAPEPIADLIAAFSGFRGRAVIRDPQELDRRATPLELLFDLTAVVAELARTASPRCPWPCPRPPSSSGGCAAVGAALVASMALSDPPSVRPAS